MLQPPSAALVPRQIGRADAGEERSAIRQQLHALATARRRKPKGDRAVDDLCGGIFFIGVQPTAAQHRRIDSHRRVSVVRPARRRPSNVLPAATHETPSNQLDGWSPASFSRTVLSALAAFGNRTFSFTIGSRALESASVLRAPARVAFI